MRYLLLIIIICITLDADEDSKHHGTRHINKELSHLDLTQEQSLRITQFLKEFKEEIKVYRVLENSSKKEQTRLFLDKEFDVARFNTFNVAIDTKAHEIENRLLLKIHTILSPKQRQKFIHYFDDWKVR